MFYLYYRAGGYERVSREDGDKVESESLNNQRELINSYVSKQDDIVISEHYSDDNYTGTNFNRPAFQRMISDIKEGKINCVIVKDLSRFGRDYIDVGNYLQKVFPKLQVRFIAINDNVDSMKRQYDIMMPVKNIFNEQYARDISTKIISTFRDKQARGQFIGAFPSYGYKRDPENKYHLIIDEYPASIVRRIYKMFMEGVGKIRIANTLNEEGVLCPAEYKKAIGLNYRNCNKLSQTTYWTYSTVNNILKNEMYTGCMVQHKSNCSKFDYTGVNVNKDSWIKVENTHDAIISRGDWETVQGLLNRRGRELNLKQNVSIFAGFLVCADCMRAMAKTCWGKETRYVCGSYKRYTTKICSSHSINEVKLKAIILNDVNEILSKINNIKTIVEERKKIANDNLHQSIDTEAELSKLKSQLERARHLRKSVYEDYKTGLLTLEEFVEYKKDYEEREKFFQSMVDKMEVQNKTHEEVVLEEPFIENLLQYNKIETLDRNILETFYKKIYIHEDKKITVEYKHEKIINQLSNY